MQSFMTCTSTLSALNSVKRPREYQLLMRCVLCRVCHYAIPGPSLTKNFNMFIVLLVHNVYVRVGWLLSEMSYIPIL